MKIDGGCLCGAVRYSGEAEPLFAGVCHCRDCQKFTGSAFGAMVGAPQLSQAARSINPIEKTACWRLGWHGCGFRAVQRSVLEEVSPNCHTRG